MGICASSSRNQKKIQNQTIPLQQEEVYMLHLIYLDLSQRTIQRRIDQSNFILFFHKHGLWGQRLFQQFHPEDNCIGEEQFIEGIGRIFKSTQKQKIQLLFKFFSKNSDSNEGIRIEELLTLLYNYPKEDLKEILSDKDFIEYQLEKRMNRHFKLSETLNRVQKSLILKKHQQSFDETKVNDPSSLIKNDEVKESIISVVEEQIIHNTHEYQPHQTIIGLKNEDRSCDIKTINIQQIVKKFAYKIFKDARINPSSGKLTFRQFYNWIIKHKTLYQNYYGGFHYQIWELDDNTNKNRFLTSNKIDKKSSAKMIWDEKMEEIQLYLIHSILVVCPLNKEKPIAVICLEGLAVTPISQSSNGFGISINHRDRIYIQKRIFFSGEVLRQEWMEQLKYFKGQSVHDKYVIGQKIGTGKFSVVYKCEDTIEQRQYAMKQIATFKLDAQALELIKHQSSIMRIIEHPLLLSFKQSIQTKKHIYIITEYVNGVNLFEEVKSYEYLDEYDAAKVAQMIIVGVSYLHSLQIVHRDLKPENIMVVKTAQSQIDFIKIIDMGFSNYLSLIREKHSDMIVGTPNYIAPQMLREEKIDFSADNFAIGAIIYFMLTGALPFNGYTIPQILSNTLSGIYEYPQFVYLSDKAKDLIDKFLKSNPLERISLHQALKHPWFDILKQARKYPRKKKLQLHFFERQA